MAADQQSETIRRIKQMVAFIKQEAKDKAEEINVRASEECNVEVLKMVDREKAKFREHYRQQEKRVEIEAKIEKQQKLDEFRMELLKFQDEKLGDLKEMAKKRFAGIVADKATYKKFLQETIMQCIFKIWDESAVTVHCRQEDRSLVGKVMNSALQAAKERAESETGEEFTMTVTLAERPINCSGGVVVTARNGKVKCDNTLDARLEIGISKDLPYVRDQLFYQEGLSL